MGKILRALQKARAERDGAAQASQKADAERDGAAKTPQRPAVARARGEATHEKLPDPVSDRYGRPDDHVMVLHERESETAAQFRSLRTKLLAPGKERMPKVMVVTSGSRGEGKTTLSINLASALAEGKHSRVLLIDADVYRPMTSEMLNVDAERGINHVLVEDLKLEGAIYRTAIPRLDLLPAVPDADAEGSEMDFEIGMAELLQRLRGHYDYILIDTPPIIHTTHAAIIGKFTDGVILVARAEKTPRQVVDRALAEIRHGGAEVLGCVLTHVRRHIPGFIYWILGTSSDRYYSYQTARQVKKKDKGEDRDESEG